MSPFTKEGRLFGHALRRAFPSASTQAIKKARAAAAYGATPAQIARIMLDDAKANATTLEAKVI